MPRTRASPTSDITAPSHQPRIGLCFYWKTRTSQSNAQEARKPSTRDPFDLLANFHSRRARRDRRSLQSPQQSNRDSRLAFHDKDPSALRRPPEGSPLRRFLQENGHPKLALGLLQRLS